MIDNTVTLRKYVGINADFDFKVIKPHLEWAEETYIPDLLGTELYDALKSYYEDNNSQNANADAYEILLEKTQRAIANIGVFDWISVGSVNISDIGLQRLEGEMGGLTRKSAFQYQERDAKEYHRRKGFNSLDAVLSYIMLDISKFEEFKTSENYAEMQGSIIPNLKIFEKHYHIGGSYLMFIKLKPFIREAVLFDIIPAIGEGLYERIINNIDNTDIKELLPELRSAIAYKAIARGIETTSVNITEDGARLILKDSVNQNFEKTEKPDMKSHIEVASKGGDRFIGLLCENIRSHSDKYPEYVDMRITPIDNTDRKFIIAY